MKSLICTRIIRGTVGVHIRALARFVYCTHSYRIPRILVTECKL
jgi:hypothetical protein